MDEIVLTNVSEVYDNFLSKISDYTFLSEAITEMDIEEELSGYLKTAIAKFYKCKNSLKIITEIDIVDGASEEVLKFESQLTAFEIEILTNLMLIEYIMPQLLSSENLKQSLSDKSFKIYSQANQLRELRLLLEKLERKANKMITEYTFFAILEEKK